MFATKTNALGSFVSVSLCGFFSIIILSYLFRGILGSKIIIYAALFFLIKLLIGYLHWEWLVHPNYFDNPDKFVFNKEYVWMYWNSDRVASYRLENGYFSDVIFDYRLALDFNKGFVIFLLVSELFFWAGSFALNISVINLVFTFFTAFVVAHITFEYYQNKSKARFAFALVVFQGMTLIPSIMMRDVIGQGLIAFSVFLSYQFRNSFIKSLIILPVSCLFFFAQRLLYVIIPLIIYGYQLFFNKSYYKWPIRVLIIPIGILIIPNVLLLFEFSDNVDHFTGGSKSYYSFIKNPVFFLTFPLQVIKGLIGVFPWFQFFDVYGDLNGKVYYPMEYMQSVMNISIVYLLGILVYQKKIVFNSIMITGLLLTLYGFLSGDLHTGYISIGFIFFIPNILVFSRKKIFSVIAFVFFTFILVNTLYYLFGIQGMSPTEFFKSKNF